jgi:hypothetical protein
MNFLSWLLEGAHCRVVDVEITSLRVFDPRETRKVAHKAGEPLFAFAERLFDAFSFGDVGVTDDNCRGRAVGARRVHHEPPRSIRRVAGIFQCEFAPLRAQERLQSLERGAGACVS